MSDDPPVPRPGLGSSGWVVVLAAAWGGALAGRVAATESPRAGHVLTACALLVLPPAALALVRRLERVDRAAGATGPARRPARPVPGPVVVAPAVVASVVALTCGVGAAVRTRAVEQGPLARGVADAARTVELHGTVVADPVRREARGGGPGTWHVDVRATTATPVGGEVVRTRERLRVLLPPPSPPPADDAPPDDGPMDRAPTVELGAQLEVRGIAQRLPDEPWARALAERGIVVELRAESLSVRAPPSSWIAGTTAVRDRLRGAAHSAHPPDRASLLTGLVTGDLAGRPDVVAQDVEDAGLSHLVAVSGSNVALAVAAVLATAAVLGVSRRAAWWAALAVVWWVVVLARAEPSVLRAAVMATLVLVALLVGRVRSPPQLLCAAAVLALLVDPLLAIRLGFALSVTATAGVLLLAPPLQRLLRRRLPRGMAAVLATTAGAQLAVAPLLLAAGGAVHPSSLPANLVAVPAAAVATAVGAVAAVAALVDPLAGTWAAVLAGPPLQVVLWSARTFAAEPARTLSATGLLGAAGAALLATGAARGWLPQVSARRPLVPAALLVAVLWTGPWPGRAEVPERPTLVVLDVGQGDAILLGDPVAGWLLVDAGPDPTAARDALRRRGVTRLAAAVLSHGHADHVAGLHAVLRDVDVGLVLHGPGPPPPPEVVAVVGRAGVGLQQVAAGDRWRHGAVDVTVLSPPPDGFGEPNDSSLVLRLDVEGGRSALLTGDAEALAQTLLLRTPAAVDVDVLKVPHHGGDTNADGFLAATTPDVAVISAGQGNPFGHPHPDVLADLAGIAVRRTDQDGDVVIPLAPDR